MASYVVLARKWRPAQFSDIVGQGHIVRTLMNAVRAERIHQAYLFTGSRGIGKTSIARIFAKAVRCESVRWVDQAPGAAWLHSCDACACCKEITAGNGVDVIEIDGASNNGVDAIREIRENAKYLPSTGSRKIYIIDEVHMLTTAAFNALLKTLEEPPAHVIFIFATTEPHKIPATILSRVQRFDFRRTTVVQIQTRLTEVVKAEGIEAEPGALALVARAAEGSMRDSLSLLDQVIAFAGARISVQSVRDSIGLIEGQTLMGILQGVLGRRPKDALLLLDQAYQQGHDLRVLTRSLIEFLHAVILAKLGAAQSGGMELSDDEWKELQKLAELRPLEEIELIFQVLHHGLDWIARSPQPKVVLDVLLVKCATAEALAFVDHAASTQASASGEPKATPVAAPVRPVQSAAASVAAPVQAQSPAPVAAPVSVSAPTSVSAPVAAPVTAAVAPAPAAKAAAPANPWEGFIALVRQRRPLLASILEHGSPQSLPSAEKDQDTLAILYKTEDAYYQQQLQSRVYSEELSAMGKEFFARHIRIKVELGEGSGAPSESLADRRARERQESETAARDSAQNHPIIREAKALFGGDLGPIELRDPKNDEGGSHARS